MLADVVASTLLVVWAALGVFSIGLLLVPSALLGCVSALRGLGDLAPERAYAVATGGAAAAVGAVAAGLWLT